MGWNLAPKSQWLLKNTQTVPGPQHGFEFLFGDRNKEKFKVACLRRKPPNMEYAWKLSSNHTAATGDLDSDTGCQSYCQEGFFLQTV
jgi:hypothetical protein